MPLKMISSTLVHKIRQPAGSGTGTHPALILLHGMGTNEDDFLDLADYLDPRFFIVSVRAPFKYEEQFGTYTWYEIREIGKQIGLPQPQQFEESLNRLEQLVLDVKQHYPVDGRRVFLFGFSMGSVIALALALTKPEMLCGIVAHSGYIRQDTSAKFAWDRLNPLSIFMAHGVDDPVIPVRLARRSHALLNRAGLDLTYREYPIPHTISEESLYDISDWLRKRLPFSEIAK